MRGKKLIRDDTVKVQKGYVNRSFMILRESDKVWYTKSTTHNRKIDKYIYLYVSGAKKDYI